MTDKALAFTGGVLANVTGFVVGYISYNSVISAVVLGLIGGFAGSCGRWLWKLFINNKTQLFAAMKNRVFGGKVTTAIAVLMMVMALVLVYAGKATLTEVSAALPVIIGLLFSKDFKR